MHGQIFMCSYVRYIFQNTFSHIMRATNVKNIWVGNIRFHVMISSFFFSLWMLTHNTHLRHYSLDTYYIIHFVFSLNTNATVFLCAFLAWEQQKSQGTKRKNGKERRRILKDYTTPDSSKIDSKIHFAYTAQILHIYVTWLITKSWSWQKNSMSCWQNE